MVLYHGEHNLIRDQGTTQHPDMIHVTWIIDRSIVRRSRT